MFYINKWLFGVININLVESIAEMFNPDLYKIFLFIQGFKE